MVICFSIGLFCGGFNFIGPFFVLETSIKFIAIFDESIRKGEGNPSFGAGNCPIAV
jgi:hypothetical protein